MTDYSKITALYSRLSVGDEDRDGGESNSIQNQKIFLENYARGQHLTNIRHYIDDDESGRFFDRSAYSRMMDDVENGKIGVCIMKDLTRWGRDYLQVGNAMEIFRRNNVRFIAVNNGIDSEKPDTLEFAPFINIMSEWYAKDISKKVKTGIKTKGMCGLCIRAGNDRLHSGSLNLRGGGLGFFHCITGSRPAFCHQFFDLVKRHDHIAGLGHRSPGLFLLGDSSSQIRGRGIGAGNIRDRRLGSNRLAFGGGNIFVFLHLLTSNLSVILHKNELENFALIF